MAQEGLEHAHHADHQGGGAAHAIDPWTRRAAVLVAALAAGAVVAEMSTNDAQTAYLTAHIAASDTWTQYQAKSVRRAVYLQSAEVLTTANPAAAGAARHEAERMASEPGHDGMQQLADRAHEHEVHRDHEQRLHDGLERGVRGLQIAIVLVSLFVVTRLRWLLFGGTALGAVAALYALATGFGLV